MNIHEYQAKELFAKFGLNVPAGAVARSEGEFAAALDALPAGKVVVKSQIHAGGRGKGTFTDGFQGGVKIAASRDEAERFAKSMLGNTLVTAQTGPAGRKVQAVYFTEPVDIEKEYYLALLLDRATSLPTIVASTEGGVEIEKVAAETPDKITRVAIDPTIGLQAHQARQVAFGLGFSGDHLKACIKLVSALWKFYNDTDASLVEINPLVTTPNGQLYALDAKVGFDDNALFRHPDIEQLRDINEEDPKEVEAGNYGLSYIALDGNIACLVNGAGLAMSTMDIIKHYGGNPANFLDVGGGASEEAVTQAFRIILSDANVKGILVNIFGGIMSCAVIARGIIAAAKNVTLNVPLVVRLEGNHVEEGRKLLAESGLPLTAAEGLAPAAKEIVRQVQAANA